MSDNINSIIAQPIGIDVLSNYAKWQALNQAQAQTALTQQQVVGAGLQNQQAQIMLGLRSALADAATGNGAGQMAPPMASGQGAPSMGPGGAGPAMAPGSGGSGNGTAPVLPVSQAALPASGDGAGAPAGMLPGMQSAGPMAAADGQGAAGAGVAPTSGTISAATHSQGMPAPGQLFGQQISPTGAVQTLYGVPLPRGMAISAAMASDPAAALKGAMEERRTRLNELLSQPDWGQGVTEAYQEGWMDPQHYQMLVEHPEVRDRLLQGLQDPDAYQKMLEGYSGQGIDINAATGAKEISPVAIGAKGAAAQAEAQGKAGVELATAGPIAQARATGEGNVTPATLTVPSGQVDANGQPIMRTIQTNRTVAATAGNAPPTQTGADLVDGTKPASLDQFAASTAQRESGGNVAARNPMPGQTASGTSGFTDSTWASAMQALHPELTAGKTPAQISALKTDPTMGAQLGAEATKWYATQNAQSLQGAGIPVNTLSLGLAHNFGPDGAKTLLAAPAAARVETVVPPDVIAANPDLRGKTVGQVIGNAYAAYGNRPIAAGAAAGAAAPTATGAPAIPGVPGMVQLTPQQQADVEVKKGAAIAQNASDITQMGDYRTKLSEAAQAATQNNTLFDQMRVAGQGFDHGAFTDTYQGIAKQWGSLVQSLGGKIPDSVGNWEEFQKDAGQLSRTAASALSPRVGVQELQLVQKYLPSATMSQQGFNRVADQLQGLNDYTVAKNAAAANFTGRPAQFEANFNANVSPGVFILHRMSAQDAAAFHRGLTDTPEGKATWARLVAGSKYAAQNGLFDAIGSGGG